MICLDSCRHFVFRHMLCILFVCLVQVFAYNVVASLGCAVCFRLLVCWAAARDLHCKCIHFGVCLWIKVIRIHFALCVMCRRINVLNVYTFLMGDTVNSWFIGLHTVKVASREQPEVKDFSAFEISKLNRFFRVQSEREWTLIMRLKKNTMCLWNVFAWRPHKFTVTVKIFV